MQNVILYVLILLIILEGLFILAFPKNTMKILNRFSKNKTLVRNLGLIEFIIGVILLAISLL